MWFHFRKDNCKGELLKPVWQKVLLLLSAVVTVSSAQSVSVHANLAKQPYSVEASGSMNSTQKVVKPILMAVSVSTAMQYQAYGNMKHLHLNQDLS